MKRSPVSALSSTSSSSSSSSFCSSPSYSSSSSSASFLDSDKSKSKRIKKIRKKQQDKGQISADANTINATSGRSSIYRGVTRHRWTGRFEAHLWDKSSWNNIQSKKGRQVYLGAYDNEEAAAHTYDLAALKYWGPETTLNFPLQTYSNELQEMQNMSKEEYLASLRRRSSGFSRGVSKYRGVARHHHNGRWEARIGRVLGNKYLYLGTYNTQEEAAAAYDMAAIEYRGANAVTNFDVSNYIERLKEKGINIEHILRPEQLIPNCSAVSEEVEIEQPRSPQPSSPQEEPQQQISSTMNPPFIDSCALINIDTIEDDELTWSFCLDSGNTLLSVPDLPHESACELPNLFDETGFEENIDLIFDACCFGNDANTEFMSENTRCNIGEVGISGNMEENGKERLSSNSPFCSTTSVSYN